MRTYEVIWMDEYGQMQSETFEALDEPEACAIASAISGTPAYKLYEV